MPQVLSDSDAEVMASASHVVITHSRVQSLYPTECRHVLETRAAACKPIDTHSGVARIWCEGVHGDKKNKKEEK